MTSTTARLFKFNLRPGIRRESTDYSESGSWYDCDRVRFRKASQKIYAAIKNI